MSTANGFQNFTRLYKLSKTLRFELIPQGRTLEHIKIKDLLQSDEERALSYKKAKKLIDQYHKYFIDKALDGLKLDRLYEFESLYFKTEKTDEDRVRMDDIRTNLRKQIAERFSDNPDPEVKEMYANLFSQELIKRELFAFFKDEEDRKVIGEFRNFTTYFVGFHENRRNIYTHEEKVTAAGYRLINEVLPQFLDNIRIYRNIKSNYADLDLSQAFDEFGTLAKDHDMDSFFEVEHFNKITTQKGIDMYNSLIGGIKEEAKKIKGLNEYVNLYRQKNGLKSRQLPNFKPLYKQILSDSVSRSFIPDAFESGQEVLDSIDFYYTHSLRKWINGEEQTDIIQKAADLLENLKEYDLDRVYLRNDASLTSISNAMFKDWGYISKALGEYYVKHVDPLPDDKAPTKAYEERKAKWLKSSHLPISLVEKALSGYERDNGEGGNAKLSILNYFERKGIDDSGRDIFARLDEAYSKSRDLIGNIYPIGKDLKQDKQSVAILKNFLDAQMELLHLLKPLQGKALDLEKDESFYSLHGMVYDQLDILVLLYNKVRNFVTSKPYSVEKIKLNFENSTLLNGWDENKEKDNSCVLLRREGQYYLGIMDISHKKLFLKIPSPKQRESVYEKMVYKLLPGANKMLPKVVFSKKRIDQFNPSDRLIKNYKAGTHKKSSKNFSLKDCHELIDFFKSAIDKHEDWSKFGFEFSDTSEYQDTSVFFKEVEQQGYSLSFKNVPSSYLDKLVEEGKLYLFKLHNKDFSPHSKGRPNLHTMYWKALFDEENLKDVVYKLNGEAEVFFRKKSLQYTQEVLERGHHADMLKGKFTYPIISNRRFAYDKFQFHVPVTINFKARGTDSINGAVNTFLKENRDIRVIGIDRGERNLLYITLIDREGKILPGGQFSLNEIVNNYNGKTYSKDYHSLLDTKETERNEARKSWGEIENIKEIKEGYLSQAVHKLARLVEEHNAIIVMEDLNAGFKRGRQKVEKQVYQKFEKMLIEKLNHLVFKDRDSLNPGGVLNAYQLSSKFTSFQKIGKQSGIIFYVPAALTSKIDPCTGFVDYLKPRYESVVKSREFFGKFISIKYDPGKDWFEFKMNYADFIPSMENTRTEWVICTTPVTRYAWTPSGTVGQVRGSQEPVNVTDRLKALFNAADIPYLDGSELKSSITLQSESRFFKELIFLLATTMNLRHNNGKKGKEEIDAILSPVADRNGRFFDSSAALDGLPLNADANGAYHIALKGLWILDKLVEAKDPYKVKLAMKNVEWLKFAQNRV
jgi:hypothetical protein